MALDFSSIFYGNSVNNVQSGLLFIIHISFSVHLNLLQVVPKLVVHNLPARKTLLSGLLRDGVP